MATLLTMGRSFETLANGITQLVQNMNQNQGQANAQPPNAEPQYVKLNEFTRVNPPTFSGLSSEDPVYFINEVRRICSALNCTDGRAIELAGMQLKKSAQAWFDGDIVGKVHTWEEFRQLFMQHFIPDKVIWTKGMEFKQLK